MIERLPLDIFDDSRSSADDSPAPLSPALPVEPAAASSSETEAVSEAGDNGAFLVSCQWCGERFDNELDACPQCGVCHRTLTAKADDSPAVRCQWCLAEVEPGLERCPQCDAHIIVPGQYVPGLDDPEPLRVPYGTLVQQAQTQQLLAGMMAGGGLDSLVGGLIGLALIIFDD